MLSREDNEMLTRTGPGTPMGNLFRRYWIPALESVELPEPDCPPVRVTLLGEQLLAFRDTNGKIGLVDEFCPHRKVSLFFGLNEGCGIRCAYHGWKFDTEGQCVDMPSEPPESNFKDKVTIKSYPCEERGGVIWTYMGPPELKPALPEQEWMLVPESHRFVTRRMQECNYFQALEGGIDSSHVSILHAGSVLGLGVSKGKSKDLLAKDTSPKFEVAEEDYGLLIGAKRKANEEENYWRITQFLMPWFTMIPPFGGAPRGGHAWVPVDDENCMTWSWSWRPDQPLTEEDMKRELSGLGLHLKLMEGSKRTIANKDNDYLIDRKLQKEGGSTAGIIGVSAEDQAVQESQGGIADRSAERLGTSDAAIIKARRAVLNACKNLMNGIEPPGLDPETHKVRAAAVLLPNNAPFQVAAKKHLHFTIEELENGMAEEEVV